MRSRWLVFVLLCCASVATVGIAAPEKIHTVYMSSESDGRHQDDHKYFCFIPYSTIRTDPSITVTRDVFETLQKAGVRNLPEARKPDPTFGPLRMFYGPKTSYSLGFYLKKTPVADAIDFYARQLTKKKTLPEGVSGLCPDGKTQLTFNVYKSSAGNQAHLGIDP